MASELRRRCRDTLPAAQTAPPDRRRRATDLLALAEACAADRERQEAERAAAEQAPPATAPPPKPAAAGSAPWRSAAKRRRGARSPPPSTPASPRAYDQAVALLEDLRVLAEREGTAAAFVRKIADLRQQPARKARLIERRDRAGLTG